MKRFQVKFTAKNLTGNAGLVHLGKFSEKLQLSKTLKKVFFDENNRSICWHFFSYIEKNRERTLSIFNCHF